MLEVNSKTKTISATISENVLQEVDKVLDYYEGQNLKVSRSSFIQSALIAYVKYVQKKIEELEKDSKEV